MRTDPWGTGTVGWGGCLRRGESMSAYHLNKLIYTLKEAARIQQMIANVDELTSQYDLSSEEIEALRDEDTARLYYLGANPILIRLTYRKKFRY
jgi:hypothetical protein